MITLGELAKRLGARVVGDADCEVHRVATLQNAGEGDIAFLHDAKHQGYLSTTGASAVIVNESAAKDLPGNGLIVENPHIAYTRVAEWLHPLPPGKPGIHPSATIDPGSDIHPDACIGPQCVVEAGAVIAEGCEIGPGCVVSRNAQIGPSTRLVANVTVCHGVKIGSRSILHPGVVIGADGFGLANEEGRWLKVPQVGTVLIGDDVEIGANTTIDRGAIENTIIGDGVKLDNLIQIGHNVQIGDHTAIAACTAIAGSARIGKHCAIGGCVGIVGHLEIADNVTITGMSHVSQAITEPGVYSSGTPLEDNKKWHRNFIRMKQLDEMAKRLKNIEKQMDSDD
ncbi:UDP-3-O-(3-hydroxymyristoyl)glucosamine N-acyltransferase [Kaarinaea lacus]